MIHSSNFEHAPEEVEPHHQEQFRQALKRIGCSPEIAGWIGARMGLFSADVAP